ncbi:MAG: hypothetical protein A3I78_10215 [Gammaproteobacteria bacterium RIFCSPLOWO2_02_FULL_56_15]|nr:MAG: hypothetical protein A3I78_10215 [Gammaproteobacteria bacterium RIFCSPLOWO2_02_FULL_56_15]
MSGLSRQAAKHAKGVVGFRSDLIIGGKMMVELKCHVYCFLGVLGGLGEIKNVMSIGFLACLAAWRDHKFNDL